MHYVHRNTLHVKCQVRHRYVICVPFLFALFAVSVQTFLLGEQKTYSVVIQYYHTKSNLVPTMMRLVDIWNCWHVPPKKMISDHPLMVVMDGLHSLRRWKILTLVMEKCVL